MALEALMVPKVEKSAHTSAPTMLMQLVVRLPPVALTKTSGKKKVPQRGVRLVLRRVTGRAKVSVMSVATTSISSVKIACSATNPRTMKRR